MRCTWKSSLAVLLGLLGTAAQGASIPWQASAAGPGEPIARAGPVARSSQDRRAPVMLDRPVPLPPGKIVVDGQVRPTSFLQGDDRPAPVVRGLAPEAPRYRPLPAGPSLTQGPVTTWQKAEPLPPPSAGPGPSVPFPDGAFLSPGGPMFDGGVVGGPGCCPDCVVPGCPGCCEDCGGECCPPGNRVYTSVEYLLWFIRGSPLPPLVTTGSPTDLRPGALDQPGTAVLFGNRPVGEAARSGVRVTAGYWFTDDHILGIEVSGFGLGERTDGFNQTSFGNPVLARPFFDVAPDPTRFGPSIQGIAAPSRSAGSIAVSNRSQFWGGEANLRSNWCCGCNYYVDALLGYKTLGLDESLNISETVVDLRPGTAGDTFSVNDRFSVRNNFNGGQMGLVGEWRAGRWSLGFTSKVALGSTHQRVDISGNSMMSTPAGVASFPNHGLLAQPTNIGSFKRDVFTVVPEVGLNLGYQFTDHLRGFVGYNFLYWSSVVRPGNQIDPVVNSNQVAPPLPGGPARPAFQFNGSEFWAHGVSLGLEFRY